MVEYECPACGEPLQSPDSLVGQMDTCPVCGSCFPLTGRSKKAQILIVVAVTVAVVTALVLALVLVSAPTGPAEVPTEGETGRRTGTKTKVVPATNLPGTRVSPQGARSGNPGA